MTRSWLDTESVCDDDARDMVQAGLFTREWKLVGTNPPDPEQASVEHLAFLFIETYSPSDELEHTVSIDSTCDSLVFSSRLPQQFEIMPISESSLLHYFDYFRACVTNNPGRDQLISLCRREGKSPCFDIPDCYLVELKHPGSVPERSIVQFGRRMCAAAIPSSVAATVKDYFDSLKLRITMTEDDITPYNVRRVWISPQSSRCDIDDSEWMSPPNKHLSRVVPCKAVATATLTVSMLLLPVYGKRSVYNDRKNLEIVVHAIK